MNKKLLINRWSVCVGSMDAITGILLIFMPDLVLKLLGIADPDNSSWVFLSWMGVFIAGVGLSYIWALGNTTQGKLVWKFTAMIRLMVAGFILWKIVAGELQLAWLLVAISDTSIAVIQLVILRLDYWREVDP